MSQYISELKVFCKGFLIGLLPGVVLFIVLGAHITLDLDWGASIYSLSGAILILFMFLFFLLEISSEFGIFLVPLIFIFYLIIKLKDPEIYLGKFSFLLGFSLALYLSSIFIFSIFPN